MNAKKYLEYAPDPNKFDLVVHRWNAQGHTVGKPNHYRLHNQNNANYYERPVNSGNLWTEGNQPAGRVELTFGPTGKIARKVFNFEAAHIEYVAPLTGDDKMHFENEQLKVKNAAMEAELALIRKEREALQAVREGVPANSGVAQTPLQVTMGPAKTAAPTLKKPGAV